MGTQAIGRQAASIYAEGTNPDKAQIRALLAKVGAEIDDGATRYKNRIRPDYVYTELLRLSPSVTRFVDTATGDIKMTAQYVREMVDDLADIGCRGIKIPYTEYFGFLFDDPAMFDQRFDLDTGSDGTYWWNRLGDARVENFNPCEVIKNRAKEKGMKMAWGTGRGGDTNLLNDLANRRVKANAQYDLTLSATSGTITVTSAGGTTFRNLPSAAGGTVGQRIVVGGVYATVTVVPGAVDAVSSTCTAVVTGTFGGTTLSAGGWYFDPMRGGQTIDARVTSSASRSRAVVARQWAKYGDESFGAIYMSHEPDDLQSAAELFEQMVYQSDSNPGLDYYRKNFGVDIIMAPSSPIDLADTEPVALALRKCGCNIIAAQDSVGPGLRFSDQVYTFVPYIAHFGLASHFALLTAVVNRANRYQAYGNLHMEIRAGIESWTMGKRPAVDLTFPARTGIGLTVTQPTAVITSADNGKWINGRATTTTGIAKINSVSGLNINVDVIEAFAGSGSFTLTAGNYAITTAVQGGYAEDYAAPTIDVLTTIRKCAPYVRGFHLYAWLGLMDLGTRSLRLDQTNSNRTDYRTAAEAAGAGLRDWIAQGRAREINRPGPVVVQKDAVQPSLGGGVATTGGPPGLRTITIPTIYPIYDVSRLKVAAYVTGNDTSGSSSSTVRVGLWRANEFGTMIEVDFDLMKNGTGVHGSPRPLFDFNNHEGRNVDYEIRVTASAGVYTVYSAVLVFEEYFQ
jgi:hypothetical protein